MPLWQQSRDWSFGLGLLALGIAFCWVGYRSRTTAAPVTAEAAPRPSIAERLRWVAYAFVPSSLLLAVTAYITTDLASAPLFWVMPLALYLATFIVAFSRRPLLPHGLMLRLQPLLMIPVVLLSVGLHDVWLLLLHLACFFVIAMVCHGELARSRPAARDLTEFYLWISLGGVLGGLFVALLAPLVFPDIWEYPLMLVAACAVRPAGIAAGKRAWRGDFLYPTLLLSGLLALLLLGNLPIWLVFVAAAVTDQDILSVLLLLRCDYSFLYGFVLPEHSFDLACLDAVSTNLDLLVLPPDEFQFSFFIPPALIPGAIEPRSRFFTEGIRHKPFCRQLRFPCVPSRQACSSYI